MVFSDMYFEAMAPPSTASSVAIAWPAIAPPATPVHMNNCGHAVPLIAEEMTEDST